MKDQVRPIYLELQGYLSQAPKQEKSYIYENQTWSQLNQTIDELEKITSKNYGRYRIRPENRGSSQQLLAITIQDYRTILGGLISRLHGEYFSDELSPIR